jgi:hypothetical protein
MRWIVLVIVLDLWLLGLVTGWTFGGFIHILFAVAIAIVVTSRGVRNLASNVLKLDTLIRNIQHFLVNIITGRRPI